MDATAPTGKTRYSARAKEVAAAKQATKAKKTKEKQVAGPVAATPEEKVAEQTQAAPLGLNGDTSKPKKQPKDKNAPKERLQNKPPTAPASAGRDASGADRGTPAEGTLPPAPNSGYDAAATPPTAPQPQ